MSTTDLQNLTEAELKDQSNQIRQEIDRREEEERIASRGSGFMCRRGIWVEIFHDELACAACNRPKSTWTILVCGDNGDIESVCEECLVKAFRAAKDLINT